MTRFWWLLISIIFCACSSSRYQPNRKFPANDLKKDYTLLRSALEAKHPSLYWYTSADSMNMIFDQYYRKISDSMTEQQFMWKILAPVIDKIHCGHTTVNMSKDFRKWIAGKRIPSFPLYFKVWNDTLAVTGNLNRKDSVFKRGTLIHSINGISNKKLIDSMFSFMPEDGYADNMNYIRLSGNFPYFHRNIFGLYNNYKVVYSDSLDRKMTVDVPLYKPPVDSLRKDSLEKKVQQKPVRQKTPLSVYRNLSIDSTGIAIMTVNGFTKGMLRRFFKRSFTQIRKQNVKELVLDIRNNSGGRVGLSTLLTRYVTRENFKVADSLYTNYKFLGKYTKYYKGKFLNNIQLLFMTRKKRDGKYHIGYLERKLFKPKRKNNFTGDLYILTGGPTFSAGSLFANVMKGQKQVLLLGEETGGGWHGNNGIMIPEFTLPITKLTVTFPLFRLVQYQHVPKTGSGVIPDIPIGVSYDAVLKGYDKKLRVVREMILKKRNL